MSTVALVYLAKDSTETGKKDRGFFWFAMLFGAAASIYGNAYHAYMNTAPGFDPIVAAGIATIAPLSLLLASHGLLVLARRSGGEVAESAVLSAETAVVTSAPDATAPDAAETPAPVEAVATVPAENPEEPTDVTSASEENPAAAPAVASVPAETTVATSVSEENPAAAPDVASVPAEKPAEIGTENEGAHRAVDNPPSSFEPTPVRAPETETTSWIPAADADVLGMPSTVGTGRRLDKAKAQQLVAEALRRDPEPNIPELAGQVGWGLSTVYRWAQKIRRDIELAAAAV